MERDDERNQTSENNDPPSIVDDTGMVSQEQFIVQEEVQEALEGDPPPARP